MDEGSLKIGCTRLENTIKMTVVWCGFAHILKNATNNAKRGQRNSKKYKEKSYPAGSDV